MGTIMLLVIIWLLKQINFAIEPIYKAFSIFITPIVFAGVFYYIFRPLYRKLGSTKLLSRSVAMIVVVVLLLLVFTGIMFYTITTVINESVSAYNDFMTWMEGRTFEPLDPRADLGPIRSLPHVREVRPNNGSFEITLREGTDVTRAMREIVGLLDTARVEVHRPTLEDVFVWIVTGQGLGYHRREELSQTGLTPLQQSHLAQTAKRRCH